MLHDVASLPPFCQEQREPYFHGYGIGPYSASIKTPEALSLVAKVEEKALAREVRRGYSPLKRPATQPRPDRRNDSSSGSADDLGRGHGVYNPLVNSSISRRTHSAETHLPPWYNVPTTAATWYEVFNRDVYVCRSASTVPPSDSPKGTRAEIFEFSDKSRANLRHVCNNSGHLVKSQFGLTYHEQWPEDGRQVKRHLHAWIKRLKRLIPDVGILWVLEFQDRGAPHFHIWLTAEPDREKQQRLAESWVCITDGTYKQLKVHSSPRNWIRWTMSDSRYAMKYADKMDQKQVPEQFHNVGRFWGHTRNMQPQGMVVEPAAVCRFAAPGVAQWDEEGLARFINRTLRRYHEKCMNYSRSTGQRRNRKRRKSPIIRGRAEIPGAFCVPFAAPLLVQIMNYVAEHGPDSGTYRRWLNNKVPF